VSRVVHLRDFFVTLFFVGLGMSIPVPDSVDVIVLAAITAAIAVLLRYVLFVPLLYATGLDRRNSVSVSTKLAQVSEFCLVIAYLGTQFGHISGMHVSVVIFAFVITALLTPLLFAASDRLYARLRPVLDLVGIRSRGMRPDAENAEAPRLVLLGFHRVGSALFAEVERKHADLLPHTLVVDTNSQIHGEIRRRGAQVLYGDIASIEVLRHAGVDGAEVIVSTVPDELLKGTTNAQLVRQLRQLAPKAVIIANCTRVSQVEPIKVAGADHVYRASSEVAIGVLPAIYAALNAGLPSYLDALAEEHGRIEDRKEVID
jgi:voltage-gated potassium channel Kch